MDTQKQFAALAAAAASMADEFSTACAKLSNEQQALVKKFDEGRKAINNQINMADQARQVAVGQINTAFAQKRDNLKKSIEELTKAFDAECIRVGLKKEDVPLSDYRVVKAVDKGALAATTVVAQTTSYLGNLWNRAKANANK
jgi:hypothetical protein